MTLWTDLLRVVLAWVVVAGAGWAVARAWGGRGAGAALAAIPTAWALTVALATVGGFVPVRFTWWTTVLGFVLVGGLGLLVTRVRRRVHLSAQRAVRPDDDGRWRGLDVLAAIGALTLVTYAVFASATGGTLETAAQTYDTASHVNVIRHVAQTGIGDPWHATAFLTGAAVSPEFYPVSFIAMAATVMRVVDSDSVVAANLCAVLLAGTLWPSTITILSRAVFGRTRTVTWCSLAVSLGTWGMPWAPLTWGVLWTTAAGAAAAPLLVAGLAGLVGLTERPMRWTAATAWLTGGALFTVLGHPRVLVLVIPIALAALLWGAWRAEHDWRHGTAADRRELVERTIAIALLSVVAGLAFWLVWRWSTTTNKVSLPGFVFDETFVGDLKNQIVGSPGHATRNPAGAILVGLGVLVIARGRIRRWGWLAVAWVLAMLLDAATVGLTWDWILEVTQWWYGDRYRSATMVSIASVPLATLGALMLWNRSAGWRERARIGVRTRKAVVTGAVAAALLIAAGMPQPTSGLAITYIDTSTNPAQSLVSPDEITFMRKVGEIVGNDGYVLNNPFDGSALLYAYTGSKPVFYHLNRASATRYGRDLVKTLRFETDHAMVCTQLTRADIRWVLTLGTGTFHGSPYERTPAIELDGPTWVSQPVLTEGDYRLSRITCPS